MKKQNRQLFKIEKCRSWHSEENVRCLQNVDHHIFIDSYIYGNCNADLWLQSAENR